MSVISVYLPGQGYPDKRQSNIMFKHLDVLELKGSSYSDMSDAERCVISGQLKRVGSSVAALTRHHQLAQTMNASCSLDIFV